MYAYGLIAPLTFPDLVALTEMILQSENSAHGLIQALAQIAPVLIPSKVQGQAREDFVSVLVHSFIHVGEVLQAKDTLRNKKIIGDAQGSTSVSMMKGLIVIYQVTQYANTVYQLVDKTTEMFSAIPEMLQHKPADFVWAVYLLFSIVSAEDELKGKITERVRQDCQRKLEELRMAFAESAMGVKAESNMYLEYHVVYMAYLLGIDQTATASRHLDYLLRWYDENAVDSSVVSRLYNLLQGLVSFQAPLDSSFASNESIEAMASDSLQLRLRSMFVNPSDSIYLMIILYKHRVLSSQMSASPLANFIEVFRLDRSAGITEESEEPSQEKEWYNAEQWLVWETLASILGKLDFVPDNAPLHASCGLVTCSHTMVALKENAFDFPYLNLSQFTIPPDLQPNPPGIYDWKEKFKDDYGWWVESILSASSLGEFCVPALPSTAFEMMSTLHEHSTHFIPSLIQIPKLAKKIDRYKSNISYAEKVNIIYEEKGELMVPDWIHLSSTPSEENIMDKLNSDEVEKILSALDNANAIPQAALRSIYRGQSITGLFVIHQIQITNPLLLAGLSSATQVPDDAPALLLGEGILEVLTWQAIVAAHLTSTDHFFVLRVVQLLVQHTFMDSVTSLKAKQCLRFLQDQGCNIRRCYELSVECYYRVRSTLIAVPNVQPYDNLDGAQDLRPAYQPEPFT
ncbi:hypothetical protein EON65_14215 [archaeon]|nr:MAG: hypothetical protein EON65_14215 [archaeon]